MKKYLLVIVCCIVASVAQAQLINDAGQGQKKQSELDWFNCSFEEDGVYGAVVNKAY